MSVSLKNRIALWTRAAGRCEYRGCNKPLLGDALSGRRLLNISYIAHIVAEDPNGPRGDPERSPLLADDINNLMLACDVHHRLIDRDGVNEHPEALLLSMKEEHERRIEIVTSVSQSMATHVVLYAARVGEHDCPARFDLAQTAVLPRRWPAEPHAIHLDLSGVDLADHEADYWGLQQSNLRRQYGRKLRDRITAGDIRHVSVFAIAPQPLLIELGRLLGDISQAEVFQLHREPPDWSWRQERGPVAYEVQGPSSHGKNIALKLGLSATINDARIHSVLGHDAAIWSLTASDPHNDILHREDDLENFRRAARRILDSVKARHGEDAVINVFPALPVSAAVELGRIWMPKADLPLRIFDQDRRSGGFVHRLTIGPELAAEVSRLEELTHG